MQEIHNKAYIMASREPSDSESDSEREEIHLSASSSSFESESDLEEEPHLPEAVGAEPYQFEPIVEEAENAAGAGAVAAPPDLPEEGREGWRLNNSQWCLCGECTPMPTARESRCCREIPQVDDRRKEVDGIQCITHHEGFQPICLNCHVLLVAYLQFRQQFGERVGHAINEQYRYTAYRQFVRWCWGYLGKHVRVVLPSCVIQQIRDAFPSAEYAGFQYPPLD